jgi:phytoene synthase
MNRIYLPQDEMRKFGISEFDIYKENMTDKMHKFMKFQVERAHKLYEEADKGIPMLARKSQFAIYSSSRIYRGILKGIEARNLNPFKGRVFVPQLKKIGILIMEIIKTRYIPKVFQQSQPRVKKYELLKKAA